MIGFEENQELGFVKNICANNSQSLAKKKFNQSLYFNYYQIQYPSLARTVLNFFAKS